MGCRARVVSRVMIMRRREVSLVRRAMEMRRRHREAMQTLSKLTQVCVCVLLSGSRVPEPVCHHDAAFPLSKLVCMYDPF
mgnify:CR=1 FL=1